jgi:ornithine--oxo-acid transaminase
MTDDFAALHDQREPDRYGMHNRHLNAQMVRVLQTIGYDVGFCRGKGAYLYDREGIRYLDLLSGFGVFALGRNHPAIRDALKSVLDSELPNLVQLDVPVLAGVLASGCWSGCPISTRCSSPIPARRRSRPR